MYYFDIDIKEKSEISILFAKIRVMLVYAVKINLNIYQKNFKFEKRCTVLKKYKMQCVKLNVQCPNNSCT